MALRALRSLSCGSSSRSDLLGLGRCGWRLLSPAAFAALAFIAGPGDALAQGAPAAKPAAAAAKPAAGKKPVGKKPPPKNNLPEWHGEATPREVVPGEKVLAALLELGGQRMTAGRYEEAQKVLTDAVNRAPLEPKPLYLRGACYQKMGKLAEAEADYRRALELDPRGTDPQTVKVKADLGAVLADSGRPAEAIEILEQAVKSLSDLFEIQYNLGVAHEALKHWDLAIAAYTRATKLKPSDANPRAGQADAYFNLGAVLRKSGRIEEAIAPTREAVQLAPDRPHTHFNLGLLLSDAKRYDEAVAELTAAIQLAEAQLKTATTNEDKEDTKQILYRSHWRLGVVHIRREQPAPAIASLEKAKAMQATPEILTDLGLARRKANDIPRAEAEFRAALQMNPKLNSARLHLVSTLATTGRCDEAMRELGLLSPDPLYTETVNRIKARCDYEQQMKARGLKQK